VTAVLARTGQPDRDLLDEYAGHVRTLGLSGRAVRDRMRIARDFLNAIPICRSGWPRPSATASPNSPARARGR
jgi:hypothetical protein